jgi:hypothetical protein
MLHWSAHAPERLDSDEVQGAVASVLEASGVCDVEEVR